MSTQIEYINTYIGTPWLKGSDEIDNGGLDCWGVVVHSFKEIEGIDLPPVTSRELCDLDGSAKNDIDGDFYQEISKPEDGCIFCCYKDGVMVHIGRILAGKAVHANGDAGYGSMCAWSIPVLQRVYKELKYYKVNH